MYFRSTMQTQISVMLALVTVTLGYNDTLESHQYTLLHQTLRPSTSPDNSPHIEFITIKHDLQTESAWTGNDVSLKGITSLDFTLPIAQFNIRWSKDNKRIAYDTSRIHFENQGLHLRINDVRMADAGTYEFRIIYPAMDKDKPSAVREISFIELTVRDDGDLCSDVEVSCNGYCIPKDQRCSSGNTSLGLIIGAVVGSVIVLFACVLLFLLSRTGRQICARRSDPGLTETGLNEDRALSDYGTPPTSRRNGAVVSFAAKPTVQIYEGKTSTRQTVELVALVVTKELAYLADRMEMSD
ncbi:uncharacterized protein [Ptychodera flava]|uniref:uncharacterized protein n=1 Tax=Ptychodera flava TaxID=63121 RepID=UPI00396A8598